jgi:asparagine synthase (glutamine-hydrolysing)
MCGLVGLLNFDRRFEAEAGQKIVRDMAEAMHYRGPDMDGYWASGDNLCHLGHKRLSIIDLSEGGRQPMLDESGRYVIVFNGEIYNFHDLRDKLAESGVTFRSKSDTEVLLKGYIKFGAALFPQLDGMFALAIYDTQQKTMVLARDRAGEKPLFYRCHAGRLVFASELKALMADPSLARRLDPSAFEHFLAYGYAPGDRSILQGVGKLPPGHAATFEVPTAEWRVWPYWQLPQADADSGAALDDLALELEGLLEQSVRRQLVADVPVGILLSGGLDSGLVTAMAARVSPSPPHTFTVTFPGHGAHDEAPYARAIAGHFGTEHTELPGEPQSVDTLAALAKQFDEPIGDSAMVPTYLLSRLIRRHATVALGGDGGDELFGGYPHYSWLLRQERWRETVPGVVRSGVARAAERLPMGLAGRHHLIGMSDGAARSIAHVNMFFDRRSRQRLAKGLRFEASTTSPEARRASLCDPRASVLQASMQADFRSTLADAYLVKVDRASMLASLEVRAPWLDHRIIEFAYTKVPDRFRATTHERKILPRRLGARLLPSSLDLRRKQGFTMPLAAWFGGEWGRFMEGVLRDADRRLFDRTVIDELIAGQRRGRANTNRLFALTMFELWRREYRVEVAG